MTSDTSPKNRHGMARVPALVFVMIALIGTVGCFEDSAGDSPTTKASHPADARPSYTDVGKNTPAQNLAIIDSRPPVTRCNVNPQVPLSQVLRIPVTGRQFLSRFVMGSISPGMSAGGGLRGNTPIGVFLPWTRRHPVGFGEGLAAAACVARLRSEQSR